MVSKMASCHNCFVATSIVCKFPFLFSPSTWKCRLVSDYEEKEEKRIWVSVRVKAIKSRQKHLGSRQGERNGMQTENPKGRMARWRKGREGTARGKMIL
jgi:hypothetical protein